MNTPNKTQFKYISGGTQPYDVKNTLNILRMKKGLLGLLVVALTVVGCKDYDDQFQSLTDQIIDLSSVLDADVAGNDANTTTSDLINQINTVAELNTVCKEEE